MSTNEPVLQMEALKKRYRCELTVVEKTCYKKIKKEKEENKIPL